MTNPRWSGTTLDSRMTSPPAPRDTPAAVPRPADAAPEPQPRRRLPRLPGWPRAPRALGAAVPWQETLREFLIIVAGVLAALGAQAWWDARQDGVREEAYLRQIVADTRENARRIDTAIAEDSAAGAALREVVVHLTGEGPLPPARELARLLMRAGTMAELQPISGTVGALMSTGDLRLIRSDSLRAELVAYAAAVQSHREMLMTLKEMELAAFEVLPRELPFTRRLFLGDALDFVVEDDFARVRRDPEFAGLLFRMQAGNSNRVARMRQMRRETAELLEALEGW